VNVFRPDVESLGFVAHGPIATSVQARRFKSHCKVFETLRAKWSCAADEGKGKRENVHMKHAGLIVYFTIAALIFAGFIYLGTTGGFSDALDIGLVVVLWLFVIAATKTGLVKVPPGWRLRPFANTTVQFNRKYLLRAFR